jgi:hypothetical protein
MVISKVRIARASKAVPGAASDWAFEDVFANPKTPCRASFCGANAKCNSVTLKCEPVVTGCAPACAGASGPACVVTFG